MFQRVNKRTVSMELLLRRMSMPCDSYMSLMSYAISYFEGTLRYIGLLGYITVVDLLLIYWLILLVRYTCPAGCMFRLR